MRTCFYAKRLAIAWALGAGLLASSAARADPLLQFTFLPGYPVVGGSNGTLSYNSTTGDFLSTDSSALTYAAPFVLPRGFSVISSPQLSIDLTVGPNGNFVANGTGVVLTGSVTINGALFTGTAANPLLFGAVTAFGAQQPAGPAPFVFDGLFTIQGGALTQSRTGTGGASVFGSFPVGSTGGFILEAENVTSGTLGNFQQSFSSSSLKPEIGVVTPEPGSMALGLLGVTAVAGWTWLRRRTT